MKKITLQISGREMTFSRKELIAIVEEHFRSKQEIVKSKELEVAQTPTEGKWFKVNPNTINRQLFTKKRIDARQESVRKFINSAFEMVDKNPEKYAKPFKTTFPKETWMFIKTVQELNIIAEKIGDHMADWVEQGLEWAQRIDNGETWEDICNKLDDSNSHKLVIMSDGFHKRVGGGKRRCNPTFIFNDDNCEQFVNTVPLVIAYD